MKQHYIDILVIAEHCLKLNSEDIETAELELNLNYKIIYNSAWSTANNSPIGGVGFIISPEAKLMWQNAKY